MTGFRRKLAHDELVGGASPESLARAKRTIPAIDELMEVLDRRLPELLIRWAPRDDWDHAFYMDPPSGMASYDMHDLTSAAAAAMGNALGADPNELVFNDDLVAACVKRFIAERQDG